MKVLKNIIIVLLVIFVSAQFFRPDKNGGDIATMDYFYTDTKPSAEVKQILQVSCMDCHSDVTHYSWYHHITPINYGYNKLIQTGKTQFNMSQWVGSSVKRKDEKFKGLIETFGTPGKPFGAYTWSHDKVKLSKAEIINLINWANLVRLKYSLEPLPE